MQRRATCVTHQLDAYTHHRKRTVLAQTALLALEDVNLVRDRGGDEGFIVAPFIRVGEREQAPSNDVAAFVAERLAIGVVDEQPSAGQVGHADRAGRAVER